MVLTLSFRVIVVVGQGEIIPFSSLEKLEPLTVRFLGLHFRDLPVVVLVVIIEAGFGDS